MKHPVRITYLLLTALCVAASASAQQQVVTPVVVATPGLPPGSTTPKKPEVIDQFDTRSIMYDDKDIARINRIVAAFLNGVRNPEPEAIANKEDVFDQILSQLDGKDDPKAPPVAHVLPSFYLSSIVYYSPTDWAVWVNGFKISTRNNKKEPPLYIESLSKQQATFTWYPSKVIIPDIRSIELKYKDWGGIASYDPITNSVSFTLRPNQTFVSGVMGIREGKVKSVSIANKPVIEGETQSQAPADALPNVPLPVPPAPIPLPQGMPSDTTQPEYQGIKSTLNNTLNGMKP